MRIYAPALQKETRGPAGRAVIYIRMSTYWLKYRGTRFPIRRGETLLGRSPYCTIVLSNPLASRQHCALKLDGGNLTITDLESANGTWINGERVDGSRALSVGDLLRV